MKLLKLILYVFTLVIFGYSFSYAKDTVKNITTITSIKGEKIVVKKLKNGLKFQNYENKIVLLEVYGDSCPYCLRAIPNYNKLEKKYKNDIVIISLEIYGSLKNANKQNYITIAKKDTGNIFKYIKTLTGYGGGIVPYLMIFDKNGELKYHKAVPNLNEIEKNIIFLLKNQELMN